MIVRAATARTSAVFRNADLAEDRCESPVVTHDWRPRKEVQPDEIAGSLVDGVVKRDEDRVDLI